MRNEESELPTTGQSAFPESNGLEMRIGDLASTEDTKRFTDEECVYS